MAVDGKIAKYAAGELPETWRAFESNANYGDEFLQRKVDSVCTSLFGASVLPAAQDALDERVADYAGKLVALELVNPGIDYWGKQALSMSATGRNETKTYNDRASHLVGLRTFLLEKTRLMWPEVESLLTNSRTNRVASVPRVRDIEKAHTPNPYDFEPAFGQGTGTTGQTGGA